MRRTGPDEGLGDGCYYGHLPCPYKTPSAGPSILQSLFLFPLAIALGAPFDIDSMEIAILDGVGIFHAIASLTLAEGAKRVLGGQNALIGALATPLAPAFFFWILTEFLSRITLIGARSCLRRP